MCNFITPDDFAAASKIVISTSYHPHYFAAIISSPTALGKNSSITFDGEWKIPAITFETNGDTRRSMTLNGMRMVTEYFAHDSKRVLVLVEQRLAAKQRDVVHDVLVYLWEQVLLIRANSDEAIALQAESLAAYLGLEPKRVGALFIETSCSCTDIVQGIQSGEAGKVQRELNVALLVENLVARLKPELTEYRQNETRALLLIDAVVTRLYDDTLEN